MPSPFPGMNPYLEHPSGWRGVHMRFLVFLQDALAPLVAPRYFVEVEESLRVDPSEGERPGLFAVADAIVSDSESSADGSQSPSAVAAAPVTATIPMPKPVRKKRRWLTIRDADKRTVVTVIELLSPSDKRTGKDWDRYLDKRNRILGSAANLVEIDLLRGGQRTPVQDLSPCDYRVMVSRRSERPRVGLWPIQLRDPLPIIPIPLRPGEAEPMLALKPVLDRVYDGGLFADRIYNTPPDPSLSAADAEWARQLLGGTPSRVEG